MIRETSSILPGLPERLTPQNLPYDSKILRFRSTPSPDCLKERLLSCLNGQFAQLGQIGPWRTSSTPTATFPGADLLYGTDGLHRDEPTELCERDRQRLRDLDIGNKRPTSRSKRPTYADKGGSDREDGRSVHNSLPGKTPMLRSNGIRNTLVRGEQFITHRASGREPDDLIAMGTLWSPANSNMNATTTPNNNNNNNNPNHSGASSSGPTRSSSTTTPSNKSLVNNGSTNNNNVSTNNNNVTSGGAQRKAPGGVGGRLGHSSSFNGLSNLSTGKNNKDAKEAEPKYGDPLYGAPASFQQRLMELASLEAETIRWERIKKVKKKPKADRDS